MELPSECSWARGGRQEPPSPARRAAGLPALVLYLSGECYEPVRIQVAVSASHRLPSPLRHHFPFTQGRERNVKVDDLDAHFQVPLGNTDLMKGVVGWF